MVIAHSNKIWKINKQKIWETDKSISKTKKIYLPRVGKGKQATDLSYLEATTN